MISLVHFVKNACIIVGLAIFNIVLLHCVLIMIRDYIKFGMWKIDHYYNDSIREYTIAHSIFIICFAIPIAFLTFIDHRYLLGFFV